jgi:pectate lyase
LKNSFFENYILGGVNTDLPKVSWDKFNAHQKALILGLEDNNEE